MKSNNPSEISAAREQNDKRFGAKDAMDADPITAILSAPDRVICTGFGIETANISARQCLINQEKGRHVHFERYGVCLGCKTGKKIARKHPDFKPPAFAGPSHIWNAPKEAPMEKMSPAVQKALQSFCKNHPGREVHKNTGFCLECLKARAQKNAERRLQNNLSRKAQTLGLLAAPGQAESITTEDPLEKLDNTSQEMSATIQIYCKNHPDKPGHKGQGFCRECLGERAAANFLAGKERQRAAMSTAQAKAWELYNGWRNGTLKHVVLGELFAGHEGVLGQLRESACENLRTLENEIIWHLKRAMGGS